MGCLCMLFNAEDEFETAAMEPSMDDQLIF